MIMKRLGVAMLCALFAVVATADDWRLKEGAVELQSAGPLAFGPDGILFVADTQAAAVIAIDTKDKTGDPASSQLEVKQLDKELAKLFGADKVALNDLAVNPASGNAYLSVTAGSTPHLVRISGSELSKVSLKNVAHSKMAMPNPPEDKVTGQGRRRRNNRQSSITDLAYLEGRVLISGMESSGKSTAIEFSFPFADASSGTNLEIFHGAHGRLETGAIIRTFVPFHIDGKPNLLAGFTCTPLVKFPVDSLKPGEQVRGTTIAELGNRNQPLDMIVYQKGGKDYLLMANTVRGVMKISTDDIERAEGITERVGGGGTAGQDFETIEGLKGVVQLDRLNETNCVIVTKDEDGTLDLQSVALP